MIEKVLNEPTKIEANGQSYEIKKLSLLQLIKLSKFLISIATKLPLDFKESKDNFSDLLIILNAIEEEQAVELYSILLGNEDKTRIKEDIISDAVTSSEVLKIVCEINDFGKIFGNFQATAEIMAKLAKPKTVPLPSSAK
jgi:hypothetical protein